MVFPTQRLVVDLTDEPSQLAAIVWWEQLTASGGEGMVVKPTSFTAAGRKGLAQPGIKCRGREYLRIIYECVFGVLAMESEPVDPRL